MSLRRSGALAGALNRPGIEILRHGLVLVVGWIGLMKFTGYEAKGIEPLVTHSPFMSWMYSFSERTDVFKFAGGR